MKAKKILGLVLAVSMIAGSLAACGNETDGDQQSGGAGGGQSSQGGNAGDDDVNVGGGEEANATPFYMTLDPNVSGELDIMTWSGDGVYHQDMGHWDAAPEDLTSINVAMVYAMAHKFNEMYPNVKINLLAKVGNQDGDGDGGNGIAWKQDMENFKAEHGKYPDIYCSVSLAQDVAEGRVADMSVYADDPLYQSFNETIMAMMNYSGMQAGLPQFLQPWGVYVNKELAETHNIEVPDPDWDIDDYTDFVTRADNTNFWGLVYNGDVTPATIFIDTGTDTVKAALQEGKELNIASDQVMALLDYIPKWDQAEFWSNYDKNPDALMDIAGDGWWWGYRFFCRNYVLTYAGDPWMLNVAALDKNEDGTWPENANIVESNDWDIYPRPATDYRGNNLGIVIDPMALHNYAMDDSDPALSDAEKANMDLAYAFGSYWCGSTDAMQARADQLYLDNGVLKSSLNDSFPLVTGDEFDKQMAIWYSTDSHKRYGDKDKMPGFQYVLELWEGGAIYDVSDKCYPCKILKEDGTEKTCLYEWTAMCDPGVNDGSGAVTSKRPSDPSWIDDIKSKLPEWNTEIKERLTQAQDELQEGLKKWYGK